MASTKALVYNMIYSLLLLFVGVTSYSQESFPKSWQGNYEGELQIFAVDS